ncbi:hypothetical protein LCI18_008519 [Fusarium solani-melongenae]|uniref:Uncharacterized protein n=1 Tax=Fusarium solani subsp. cucurbitae TaxID=2747967 RepID=A0ACD3Z8G0_FUSSC|nr:hypothetical protein LCI18_008519 [Fusarium solani-melongenae]
MQFSLFTTLVLMAASGANADLHRSAACVSNRKTSPIGGTPWSPSYNWKTSYEVLPDATRCACNLYRNRNTGNKKWDKCPDCTFDGIICGSKNGHIGGDEFTYYCEKKCGAQGAEAD